MARYKVTPAPVKRGPGRPRKNPLEVAAPKRGRKPGIKNKSFLEKVVIQADAIEVALAALNGTLSDAIMKDDVVPTQNILTAAEGLIKGITETLTDAVGKLSHLPEGYVPGKKEERVLSWEKGSFVVFKNDEMKKFFKDAYEIVSLIELGKGAGNGTMVQLTGIGVFPKSQLMLIDGETLEEAKPSVPSPRAAPVSARAPRASAPRNGHVLPAVEAVVVHSEAHEDDLNA